MPTSCASNLEREFERLGALLSPQVTACKGQYVKLAEVKGEFVWHCHTEEEDFFSVLKGTRVLRSRARRDAVAAGGAFHGLPRGVASMTAAPEQCRPRTVKSATTRQAGDSARELTTSIDEQLARLRPRSQETRPQETQTQWPSKS